MVGAARAHAPFPAAVSCALTAKRRVSAARESLGAISLRAGRPLCPGARGPAPRTCPAAAAEQSGRT